MTGMGLSLTLPGLALSILVGTSVGAVFYWLRSHNTPLVLAFGRYQHWWNARLMHCRLDQRLEWIPTGQAWVTLFSCFLAIGMSKPLFLALFLAVALIPPWLVVRYRTTYERELANGLDTFLTTLADSLTTVPNLTEALSTVLEHSEHPIKGEVQAVLGEVQLGRSLDDALENMARRLKLPGFDTAVAAALLGKRTGGDLSTLLRQIAGALREMARLDGVVRSKTAEGRSQAWVMGSVPPALILILDRINPEWLAPMFSDPIGWIMLGCTAVVEIVAVALIRKIMAVDI